LEDFLQETCKENAKTITETNVRKRRIKNPLRSFVVLHKLIIKKHIGKHNAMNYKTDYRISHVKLRK
jgi:hypothetical protein